MDFILREWHKGDAASVAKYANNQKIADNLRNAFPFPYGLNDAQAFIESMVQGGEAKQCCRAIEINGEAVGSIGIFLKDDVYFKSAELGYWLAEPYWGKNIMRRAIVEICAYAFLRYDIVRIFAEPYAHNIGSRKALEYAGFTLEGILQKSVCKHGEIFDSCMYALIRT